MIYLALHILFGSFFILFVRYVQSRGEDVITIGAVNYLVAAVGALFFYLAKDSPVSAPSLLTGALNGLCYFVAFFFLLVALSWKGAALSALVARLSILLPILLGVIAFGERPTLVQTGGVVLACLSLSVLGIRRGAVGQQKPPPGAIFMLIGFFLISGGSRVAQELFKHTSPPAERPAYLLSAFGLSAAASVVLLIVRRRPHSPFHFGRPIAMGLLLGMANLLQTWAILTALNSLEGFIVFPLASAGSLLFTTAIAVWGLNEKLNRWSYAGVAMAVCALFLLQPGASWSK